MKFGIKNYNDECRKIVMRCADEWKDTIGRFGRWIDFENDYKTMNISYMESIWWCFKQMWNKDLVYQGFKVMPYSTACGTPLSNFEAKSNYKQVNEESVIVKFQDSEEKISYLVWTTTPWTLPSNMALCVNANIEYSLVEFEGSKYVLASTLIVEVFSSGKKKKVPKELKVLKHKVPYY
jgi:isoleucyl-tRNA synthetase